jgi:hypothetical protein
MMNPTGMGSYMDGAWISKKLAYGSPSKSSLGLKYAEEFGAHAPGPSSALYLRPEIPAPGLVSWVAISEILMVYLAQNKASRAVKKNSFSKWPSYAHLELWTIVQIAT